MNDLILSNERVDATDARKLVKQENLHANVTVVVIETLQEAFNILHMLIIVHNLSQITSTRCDARTNRSRS